MTCEQAIQQLSDHYFRVLIIGVDKDCELKQFVCCTREQVFEAIKSVGEFRLFFLKESKEDAVYLKNESKKL